MSSRYRRHQRHRAHADAGRRHLGRHLVPGGPHPPQAGPRGRRAGGRFRPPDGRPSDRRAPRCRERAALRSPAGVLRPGARAAPQILLLPVQADADSLAAAEEHALAETAEHAGLADGQDILELGCGWGSLSLWMAERFPGGADHRGVQFRARNARYIEARSGEAGIRNLRVITADMNDFAAAGTFDRIVSVEMFEHMTNWQPLLHAHHGWLRPDGRLFLHVFSHRRRPIFRYRRQGGLDRAAFLHRRDHAEPRPDPPRSPMCSRWRRTGAGTARTTRARRATGWPISTRAGRGDGGAARCLRGGGAALEAPLAAVLPGDGGAVRACRGEEWGVSHYRLRPL